MARLALTTTGNQHAPATGGVDYKYGSATVDV